MSKGIGRPCLVCGRTTYDGSRCPEHSKQYGKRQRSCVLCGALTWTNYCDTHAAEEQKRQRRERAPYMNNYSAEYYRNRRQALQRDRWRCVVCGKGQADGVRVETDHIVALRDGGTNDVGNLQTLCLHHHRNKTAARRRERRDR